MDNNAIFAIIFGIFGAIITGVGVYAAAVEKEYVPASVLAGIGLILSTAAYWLVQTVDYGWIAFLFFFVIGLALIVLGVAILTKTNWGYIPVVLGGLLLTMLLVWSLGGTIWNYDPSVTVAPAPIETPVATDPVADPNAPTEDNSFWGWTYWGLRGLARLVFWVSLVALIVSLIPWKKLTWLHPWTATLFWIALIALIIWGALNVINHIVNLPTDATPGTATGEAPVGAPAPTQIVTAPTQAPAAPQPTQAPVEPSIPPAPITPLAGQVPEYYFNFGKPLDCKPANEAWIAAFGQTDKTFIIDMSRTDILLPDHVYFFEGEFVDLKDVHQVFFLTGNIHATQANIWDCGLASKVTDADKHITVFWSAAQKVDNWHSQVKPPYHPVKVTTAYGVYDYERGVYPPSPVPLPGVCQYTGPKLFEQDPVADQFNIITPGSVGCDFIVIKPGSIEAARYKGVIERFEYINGMLVFLFNPDLTNKQVQSLLSDLGYPGITVVNH